MQLTEIGGDKEMRGCSLQTTDLTPRCPGLEVCLLGPSPFMERGGLKRGLHSNCWGEVWRTTADIVAFLEFIYPGQPHDAGEEIAFHSLGRRIVFKMPLPGVVRFECQTEYRLFLKFGLKNS